MARRSSTFAALASRRWVRSRSSGLRLTTDRRDSSTGAARLAQRSDDPARRPGGKARQIPLHFHTIHLVTLGRWLVVREPVRACRVALRITFSPESVQGRGRRSRVRNAGDRYSLRPFCQASAGNPHEGDTSRDRAAAVAGGCGRPSHIPAASGGDHQHR